MTHSDAIVNQFLNLVKISSPSGHENEMANYLKLWLKIHNFKFKQDKLGSIIATKEGEGESLLFSAHMDTVEPGQNIKPVILNGIIKSDGSTILGADNKAALAALLEAVEEYCEKGGKRPLELLFTVKEECGGGVNNFPFKWINSKTGFIFDYSAPIGKIAISSPEIINFTVKFIGKAGHSSKPEKGINALIPAVQFLQKIGIGSKDNGKTTINVGVVEGGKGINIIPETINLRGEIRSSSKKLFKSNLLMINNLAISLAKKYKTKLIFLTDGYCPGYSHSKNSKVISKLSKLYKQINIQPKLIDTQGISDANVLNNVLDTVNMSDGTKNAHSTTESISVNNLKLLARVILNIMVNY